MRPGPGAAFTVADKYIRLDMPPTRVTDVLLRIIKGEGWYAHDSEAAEKAEQWERRVIERLRRHEGLQNTRGGHCFYTFNSSDSELLQGACYIEGNESKSVQEAKRRRQSHADLLAALRALNPTDFEYVCRGMLDEMGVTDATVTQRSADNGIDFYGRLALAGELRRAVPLPGMYTALKPWMVGQAKHYVRGTGATPDLRQLVGSVQLAKSKAYPKRSNLEGLNIRACDPVFYLFFTTGAVSRDGWELAEESGIVVLDGPMVAQFLADHSIGWSDNRFDGAELSDWIASNAV